MRRWMYWMARPTEATLGTGGPARPSWIGEERMSKIEISSKELKTSTREHLLAALEGYRHSRYATIAAEQMRKIYRELERRAAAQEPPKEAT